MDELQRLRELADSEGTRAVEYLRRARKAEAAAKEAHALAEHYMAQRDNLSAALLDCARRCEALKRPCGMDPESAQALRNGEYMSIALAARAALGPNGPGELPAVGGSARPGG